VAISSVLAGRVSVVTSLLLWQWHHLAKTQELGRRCPCMPGRIAQGRCRVKLQLPTCHCAAQNGCLLVTSQRVCALLCCVPVMLRMMSRQVGLLGWRATCRRCVGVSLLYVSLRSCRNRVTGQPGLVSVEHVYNACCCAEQHWLLC